MGRKSNIFSAAVLASTSLSKIIDRAVAFNAKMEEKEVTTRDTLRCDCLIKTLIGISAEEFNSKTSINDKLINKLLSRDTEYTGKVIDQLLSLGGWSYDDINNMVYYLTWFACTDIEPEFKTLNEFTESLNND